MKRLVVILVLYFAVTGCVTTPRVNDAGEQVIDTETGEPAVDYEFDLATANELLSAAAVTAPGPWSLAVPAIFGLAGIFFGPQRTRKD